MALTFYEEVISLFASLDAAPIAVETPIAVREQQSLYINALSDRALTDENANWVAAWEVIPYAYRQMFFLAGMAALDAALESIEDQGLPEGAGPVAQRPQ